jgi:hypothetical protein
MINGIETKFDSIIGIQIVMKVLFQVPVLNFRNYPHSQIANCHIKPIAVTVENY